MTQSVITVGMIGVGGIAQGHVERLSAIAGVRIVGLADPSEANIENTVQKHAGLGAVKKYADYEVLLKELRPDAVVICTPHTQHFEQAVNALDAGAHVLLEKPMVCQVDHAQKLLAKIEASGKVFGLAYQRHTDPQFRYIRERIASGEVGAVKFFTALQQQDWKRHTKGKWRQDPALSGGGQLNDSGSHLLDVVLWTTGLAPEAVAAFIDNRGTLVDIDSAVTVRFVGGAVGTLNVHGDAPGWWEDITIWCERGAFYVRQGHPLKIQKEDGSFEIPDASVLPPATNVNANFIHAIQGKEPIAAPAICGLRTIELTEAAWESGAAGGQLTMVKRSA
ncbi:MAG: Gfo/Idh/MocA family oxidoreductase [Capsulimonadaceae bacterium]|nr:Gfo/Idh/MocA family oxidoreductase [Capsulimonadaceae bacterium]